MSCCETLYALALSASNPCSPLPYLSPITIKAPVTAPHVSCLRAIPDPNGLASLRQQSFFIPKSSANTDNTDCEQLYPFENVCVAKIDLSLIRRSLNVERKIICRVLCYHSLCCHLIVIIGIQSYLQASGYTLQSTNSKCNQNSIFNFITCCS